MLALLALFFLFNMSSFIDILFLSVVLVINYVSFEDFNEVLCNQEKSGGRDRLEKQMIDFRQVLDDCALSDMGYHGSNYTWCNGLEFIYKIC